MGIRTNQCSNHSAALFVYLAGSSARLLLSSLFMAVPLLVKVFLPGIAKPIPYAHKSDARLVLADPRLRVDGVGPFALLQRVTGVTVVSGEVEGGEYDLQPGDRLNG